MNAEHIRYLEAMGIQSWCLKNKTIDPELLIVCDPLPDPKDPLFNAMLESIGLNQRAVCLVNTLDAETKIALIKPVLIFAFGEMAAHFLLKTTLPLDQLRGKVHSYGQFNTPLMMTYHPVYLLQNPREKNKAFHDLQLAQSFLIE